jgi:hypothetical protein
MYDECIEEIVDLIATKIGNEKREIHPETAIASCARLAGLFLFLSCNFNIDNLEQGSILLSEEANDTGCKMLNYLGSEINNYGLQINKKKIGKKGTEKVTLNYIETLEKIQTPALAIIKKYNLNSNDAILAALKATAFILFNVSAKVDATEGFTIAAHSFVEASKTVPLHG